MKCSTVSAMSNLPAFLRVQKTSPSRPCVCVRVRVVCVCVCVSFSPSFLPAIPRFFSPSPPWASPVFEYPGKRSVSTSLERTLRVPRNDGGIVWKRIWIYRLVSKNCRWKMDKRKSAGRFTTVVGPFYTAWLLVFSRLVFATGYWKQLKM